MSSPVIIVRGPRVSDTQYLFGKRFIQKTYPHASSMIIRLGILLNGSNVIHERIISLHVLTLRSASNTCSSREVTFRMMLYGSAAKIFCNGLKLPYISIWTTLNPRRRACLTMLSIHLGRLMLFDFYIIQSFENIGPWR